MKKHFLFIISCIVITPLIFLIIGDPSILPKFVWIFFTVVMLSGIGIKEKIFGYRNTFIVPVGLLLLWYIITLTRCINIFAGLHSIFILILFITLYVSLENLIARDNFLIEYFLRGVFIVSVIISVYGILQVCGIDFVNWNVRSTPASTLGRRNFAGEYLVMVIPYVYYLIYRDRKQWILPVGLFLLIIHLILTFTRASYLGFIVSGVVFFILTSRRVIKVEKKAVIIMGILLFSQVSFSGIKTFEKGTVGSRILIWKVTLDMIKQNPIMGVGAGNFVINYPYYGIGKSEVLRGQSLVVDRVHNDYLEVCAETGIPGLLLFLYFLFLVFKVGFKLYRDGDDKERVLLAGIMSSIVAICVNAFASFPFKNPSTLLLFWVNVSFIGGIYRKRAGERKIKFSYPLLKTYLILFAITGALLSVMGVKASRYIYLARNTDKRTSLIFSEKASSYNPFSCEYLHFAGTSAMNLNEYQKAYILLSRAKKLNPYYDSIHNNLGTTFFCMGNLEKAEESFLAALKLNPDSYEFNNNTGFLYLNTGRYDDAIKYLQKAAQLKPNAYISFHLLGVAYYMKGQYREAEEQFKKTLEINPDFSPSKEYLKKLSH